MPPRDFIAALIVLAFGAVVFAMAGSFDPAAALFPRAVASIMMVSAVALGLRAFWRQPEPAEPTDRLAMLRVGLVIVLTFLYVAGVATIGFATASLAFIPLTAWLLGVRKIGVIAATTIIFVGVIVFLFRHVFHIPLPREILLGMLG